MSQLRMWLTTAATSLQAIGPVLYIINGPVTGAGYQVQLSIARSFFFLRVVP